MSFRSLLVRTVSASTVVGLAFFSGCGESSDGPNQADEPNKGFDMPAPSKPSAAVTKGDPKSTKGASSKSAAGK